MDPLKENEKEFWTDKMRETELEELEFCLGQIKEYSNKCLAILKTHKTCCEECSKDLGFQRIYHNSTERLLCGVCKKERKEDSNEEN